MHPNLIRRDPPGAIPARTGVGLRASHYAEVLGSRPRVGFFEVHSENFFGAGGYGLDVLDQVRSNYPISLHGVGLSLGSTDPLNTRHLDNLAHLISRVEPFVVSEHLCWSSFGGEYFNDLLPLPYTAEALDHLCARIDAVQTRLGRRIAIENLSSYLEYSTSTLTEWDFLAELASRSGCAILLDVNNVYVAATNHGFDPIRYLDAMPRDHVAEIHLAGHTRREVDGQILLIDTHDQPIADPVWDLYDYAAKRLGPIPTTIEWDSNLPPLAALVLEARRADCLQENCYDLAA
jgi:uncharacterized protein